MLLFSAEAFWGWLSPCLCYSNKPELLIEPKGGDYLLTEFTELIESY